ncbi:MAG: site-specific integrase [Rhodoglobus sp.]
MSGGDADGGGADQTGLTRVSMVGVAVREWLVVFEGMVEGGERSPTTLDIYRYEASRLVVPGVGGLRVGELTVLRLDRFLQGVLVEKGYATAKVCRQVLSGLCGWLVRQGVLSSNPVRGVTSLEVEPVGKARALTVGQLRAWFTMLDVSEYAQRHDLPDLARFMLGTGLRLGEAIGVTWADLDLVAGVVTVGRTIVRVRGKSLVAKGVKSTASGRVLVLPGWCVELLKARRVRFGGVAGPVFPDARGGWRDRSNIGKAFRLVRAGTEFEWVRCHTYRATVAAILDESGATAYEVAQQLGHSRASMTQNVYMTHRASNSGNAAALDIHNLAAKPQHKAHDS